jgi:hypothetical protein
MNLYCSKEFSDEEGPQAEEFKTAYINGTREEILELCSFFKSVEKELNKEAQFHKHFQDYSEKWNKLKSIDIALEVVEEPTK